MKMQYVCLRFQEFRTHLSLFFYRNFRAFLLLFQLPNDPEKRTLRRITLDDAVKADETFTVLMGEKVEPRKEFIEKNAKYAVNLDY